MQVRLRTVVFGVPIVVGLASLTIMHVATQPWLFAALVTTAVAAPLVIGPLLGNAAARSLGFQQMGKEISVIAGALCGMVIFAAAVLCFLLVQRV